MFGAVNLRSSEQLTTQFGWSGHCPLSILNGENWIEMDKPPETRTKRSKYCTQKICRQKHVALADSAGCSCSSVWPGHHTKEFCTYFCTQQKKRKASSETLGRFSCKAFFFSQYTEGFCLRLSVFLLSLLLSLTVPVLIFVSLFTCFRTCTQRVLLLLLFLLPQPMVLSSGNCRNIVPLCCI